ncbi:desmoplakin [Urbanus proteus nucleopolyhedrovirus]|uniref:Desmoplakin n=1 Tax=Urbanus proteus nucleopolyhedrovirus TaxID=1675866 RepID=A0A162GUP0_9ABAC|nr:desmoplakin [Urbanus proteus nucleopolyhedrovirus]AKR17358.1 desmoplakin [Urbanus proteus nucleopolyhedrovirus]
MSRGVSKYKNTDVNANTVQTLLRTINTMSRKCNSSNENEQTVSRIRSIIFLHRPNLISRAELDTPELVTEALSTSVGVAREITHNYNYKYDYNTNAYPVNFTQPPPHQQVLQQQPTFPSQLNANSYANETNAHNFRNTIVPPNTQITFNQINPNDLTSMQPSVTRNDNFRGGSRNNDDDDAPTVAKVVLNQNDSLELEKNYEQMLRLPTTQSFRQMIQSLIAVSERYIQSFIFTRSLIKIQSFEELFKNKDITNLLLCIQRDSQIIIVDSPDLCSIFVTILTTFINVYKIVVDNNFILTRIDSVSSINTYAQTLLSRIETRASSILPGQSQEMQTMQENYNQLQENLLTLNNNILSKQAKIEEVNNDIFRLTTFFTLNTGRNVESFTDLPLFSSTLMDNLNRQLKNFLISLRTTFTTAQQLKTQDQQNVIIDEITKLKNDYETLQQQNLNLLSNSSQVDELQTRIDILSSDNASQKITIAKLNDQLNTLREQEQKGQIINQDLEQLRLQNASLSAQLQTYKSNSETNKRQITDLTQQYVNENKRLSGNLNALQLKFDELQNQLSLVQKQNESLQQRTIRDQQKIRDLEKAGNIRSKTALVAPKRRITFKPSTATVVSSSSLSQQNLQLQRANDRLMTLGNVNDMECDEAKNQLKQLHTELFDILNIIKSTLLPSSETLSVQDLLSLNQKSQQSLRDEVNSLRLENKAQKLIIEEKINEGVENILNKISQSNISGRLNEISALIAPIETKINVLNDKQMSHNKNFDLYKRQEYEARKHIKTLAENNRDNELLLRMNQLK